MSVQQAGWTQTVINTLVGIAIAFVAYWVSQQDAKNVQQDTAIATQRESIIGLEKDTEYSKEAFKSIDGDMKELITEVKKLTSEVARLQK